MGPASATASPGSAPQPRPDRVRSTLPAVIFPSKRRVARVRRAPALLVLGLAALALVASACSTTAASPSFDASTPCNGTDATASGAYPALEAMLPRTLTGRRATTVNSGRYCSAAKLGTLESRGIHELHFAGAQFESADGESGMALVVYQGNGLSASLMADAFLAGAAGAKYTADIGKQSVTIDGQPGFRIDALNNGSRQSVLFWPSADGSVVKAIIASDASEAGISDAEQAFRS